MSTTTTPIHPALAQRPDWADAMARLTALADARGQQAVRNAAGYAARYAGRRGAMVVDVVASRQRNYRKRVQPMVARWEDRVPAGTLAALVAVPDSLDDLGLQQREPATILNVAQNLLSYGVRLGLTDEDEIVARWAADTDGLEHGYRLDPVVGAVSGIGIALFCYMRMRAGGSAIKPDVRVRKALEDLGLDVPRRDDHALLTLARAAAAEVDMDLLTFDQLLWFVREG